MRSKQLAKLAVIDHQNVMLRHRHCPVLHRQFFQIKTGRAFLDMNACRGIKGDIRTQIVQRFLEVERFKNRVTGMEFATTQNDAALRFFLQHQKRIQRVADCGEGQFIVDRSKFGKVRPARMGELKRFDTIISDNRPDDEFVEYAKAQRITLKY